MKISNPLIHLEKVAAAAGSALPETRSAGALPVQAVRSRPMRVNTHNPFFFC
jgi:hypothetical protein